MRRICFVLKIRPGVIEEYEARHNHLWPGLADAMRVAGISNYMRPWQRVDILVNRAAILRRTEFSDLDSATFETIKTTASPPSPISANSGFVSTKFKVSGASVAPTRGVCVGRWRPQAL